MSRTQIPPYRWALWPATGLILLAGCATSAPGWKLSGWGSSAAAPTQADSAAIGSTGVDSTAAPAQAEGANPFRSSVGAPVQTASAEGVLPGQTRPVSVGSEAQRFDPATLMLIETEFKDATAEERKQWFQELKQIPPELVPQVLKMRRLAQQASGQMASPQASRETPPPTSPSVANSAGSSQRLLAGSENHLGGLAPWEEQLARNNLTSPGQNASPGGIQMTRAEQHAGQTPQIVPAGTSPLSNQPMQLNGADLSVDMTGVPSVAASADALDQAGSALSGRAEYQQALERLIALSEQQVSQMRRGDLEEEKLDFAARHAYLRMLYLMAERQERALEAIPQLPPAEQEFWQQMFWAMSSYFDSTGIPNPADRATHTVSQLSEANLRLRERANLELRNLTFCKKIDGFGSYERFDRDEFRPGQAVLVYAEMRNFLSEPTNDGQYKTVLKSTIEIHRAGSQAGLVTRQDFSPTEDLCRNRRHDYFHSYLINIPERVTVGPHILKLIVEDQLNRKIASYTVNFTVN